MQMEIWYVKDGDKVETFPNQIRKKELVKRKIYLPTVMFKSAGAS